MKKKPAAAAEEPGGAGKPEGKKHGGWKTMPYIIGNETFERVASFGLTANLVVYLLKKYHLNQVDAVTLTQIWNGTTSFVPLLGAYLADAYWGKFKTLLWACTATLLGMVVMTLTAAVRRLHPPRCGSGEQCQPASHAQIAVLILALGLLTLGAAGIRPCNLPFGMDQFDRTTAAGRKATNSYFNWYYTTNTLAVVVGMTLIVYLQDSVSWSLGFGVSSLLMLLALVLFLVGSRIYIRISPEGSIFSGIAQVLVAAFRKRSLSLPSPADQELSLFNTPGGGGERLPLTQQLAFLNKAAVKLDGEADPVTGAVVKPWRLSTVQRVEEVKCLIRVMPIWLSGITCMVAIAQQFTYAVLQSLLMDRHLGRRFEIPPATIPVVSLLAIVVFLPVYDRVFVPVIRRVVGRKGVRHEGGITLLQRMGVGIAISAASMAVAGAVERRRRRQMVEDGSLMSALWLVPQLALVGISEAFNAVGQIEFYNQEFPAQMRSLATSLFSCSIAGANYLSSIVVALVHSHTSAPNWLDDDLNSARLDYFYYLLAGMGAVDLLYFLVVAHLYSYKSAVPAAAAAEAAEIAANCKREPVGA